MITKRDLSKIDFKKNKGLVPAIVQDYKSGKVLMLAYQNKEALERTIDEKETWFYSRSRKCLWHKGATSGNIQKVKEIKFDCDFDTILMQIQQKGGEACHRGTESCFD